MLVGKLQRTIEEIRKIYLNCYYSEPNNNIVNIIHNIKVASILNNEPDISIKINNIRTAYINNWRNENISFINNLITKIDLERGIPLPILSICGKGTQEIRYTKYLSYFLDPSKKHGLANKLLDTMISPECLQEGLDVTWNQKCDVISEIKLGEISERNEIISCFGDIGIEGDGFFIIIEQKILSRESGHPGTDLKQLERYDKAMNENDRFNNRKLVKIYLTPEKVDHKVRNGWINLTHGELIDRGIVLLKSREISSIGRGNLLRLLVDLVTGPYEVSESVIDEIITLGTKLENEGFNLPRIIQFNRLVEENQQLLELLMEA